jgi:hypothetical protein
MTRLLMVPLLTVLLSSCGATQQEAVITSPPAPKYKACPINSIELEHHGGYVGPFAFDGPLTAEAREARGAREAAESSPSIPCPVFSARPQRPQTIVIEGGRPPMCQWMNGMGSCI